MPYLGSGPHNTCHAGSQYYSESDYSDILRRATKLHVQVIPEIDMPGHMHAAIQSMRVRTAKLTSQGLCLISLLTLLFFVHPILSLFNCCVRVFQFSL